MGFTEAIRHRSQRSVQYKPRTRCEPRDAVNPVNPVANVFRYPMIPLVSVESDPQMYGVKSYRLGQSDARAIDARTLVSA